MKKRIAFLLCVMMLFLSGCTTPMSSVSLGNVMILGDSYSTFEGCIPEGYASWYSAEAGYTDVHSERQTWWYQLAERTKSKLLLNCSFSGTTICHTGYDGEDLKETSFAGRIKKLIEDAFFEDNRVDTLFIYGGLNDYWAHSPLGEPVYGGWTDQNLYQVYPALCYILSQIQAASPDTRIIFIIEEYLGEEMKAGFGQICDHYGVETISVNNISKQESHPDLKGMDQITDQIISYLESKEES